MAAVAGPKGQGPLIAKPLRGAGVVQFEIQPASEAVIQPSPVMCYDSPMGKKAQRKAKHAVDIPLDGELEAEAAYYARKVGITIDEAAKLIREANPPKFSIVPKGKSK
ncbi:hypothetical protein RFM98_20640 [Mesorhizobium sp. VK9D]|uniref:hypothetical protein n=1 Tax=Mesorhizobium australafricanum TaxID=3072311 RepID=UPI002A245E34|nr:hypothetical protein [Mesorhizobium sp. VK9D]MDX8455167.1 hypothetical protein [Mesorhizobium sp. VK9D]